MEKSIQRQAEYWSQAAVFDGETRKEISRLLVANESKELAERFYRDLEFGTGGLRGIVGAGTNRMNVYNVRKASAALARYARHTFGTKEPLKVAISYDSRNFSREFAEATAGVFAAEGFTVLITKELRPVPMLSYLVRQFKCKVGICITASHNPPIYNGFKVYWEHGGQIIPPHDEAVIKIYNSIEQYEGIKAIDFKAGCVDGLIQQVGAELDEPYFAAVEALSIKRQKWPDFRIVYSPLHGTGAYPVGECLRRFGFSDVHIVPEQREPDGNFPTVEFPNPEDPKALKLAVSLAEKIKADLVLATDPDSDRLGIVVREGNDYLFLNGNQIGCLLTEYYLSALQKEDRLPANPLVVKTIVTTDLQRKIAEHYGATCEETLTGFKWICGLVEEYESGRRKPYRHYVCGGEESYGFLAGLFVRDKDGVSAACIAAEAFASFKSKGLTATMVLDQLFRLHGVYHEVLHTETLPGREGATQIQGIMSSLRANLPREIAGIPVRIVKDLLKSQIFMSSRSGFVQDKPIPLPSSDVLQFVLEDETVVSVRPSGTEPKIKFYVSAHLPSSPAMTQENLDRTKRDCQQKAEQVTQALVRLFKT